jgi:mono/diheme cytochrome c family protein
MRTLTLMVMAAALWAGNAAAAGDPRVGQAIARTWCVSCHATATGQTSATDIAPPFIDIANDPARTPTRLRTWLTDPHPPMPDPGLTRAQIDDIIAYIRTLRRR